MNITDVAEYRGYISVHDGAPKDRRIARILILAARNILMQFRSLDDGANTAEILIYH